MLSKMERRASDSASERTLAISAWRNVACRDKDTRINGVGGSHDGKKRTADKLPTIVIPPLVVTLLS
jgi:hypothetical protein